MEYIDRADITVIRQRVIADAATSDNSLFGLTGRPDDIGVKDENGLRSALDRQQVGSAGALKYDTPELNAATLAFGLVKNHAFQDGNKRTALISMLVHLDKNRRLLPGIRHRKLVHLMENIAMSLVPVDTAASKRSRAKPSSAADLVVQDLSRLLTDHTRAFKRYGYRSMTYRKLRKLLTAKGFILEGPIAGNRMNVLRKVKKKTMFGGDPKIVHVDTIGWPGDSRQIDSTSLKTVRTKLGLRAEDGVDDAAFYDLEETVEGLVNEYRNVLRRLENR